MVKRKRELPFTIDQVKRGGAIGLTWVWLGFFGATYIVYGQHTLTIAKNDVQISTLSSKVSELEDQEKSVTVEEIEAQLNSATESGNQVAEYENTWNQPISDEERALYTERLQISPNTEQAAGTQSDEAYNGTRILRMKELMDVDGVKQWYSYSKGTLAEDSVWSFVTSTSFTSDAQNVMWQCRNKNTNELYAYVTAVYDTASKKFTKVSINVTAAGKHAQQTVKGGS